MSTDSGTVLRRAGPPRTLVGMSREHHSPTPRGFRRGTRIADQLTPELTAFLDRTMAAERCGDLEEALEYYSGVPMLRRGRHRSVLEQLVAAQDELTPWVWARWIAYQALRCEDRDRRTGLIVRAATHDAVGLFHGDLMDAAYDAGGDPVKVVATVMGESWAFHQLATHDYAGLETFLDECVTGRLAEHAVLARSWVGAPMGGYRIDGPSGPRRLAVLDLATDELVDVLDLGASSVAGPGGWVIGRLVPSGTTPELMFDIAPLGVPEALARTVARHRDHRAGPNSWPELLAEALGRRELPSSALLREDYELMSDIPAVTMIELATRPLELARVMSQLRSGRDEVARTAFRILRSVADGSLESGDAPHLAARVTAPMVAAAVLNASAFEQAPRKILAPGQESRWRHWAAMVPQPARDRLLRFAEATRGLPLDAA